MATTMSPSCRVSVMEVPFICSTGSRRTATRTATAATTRRENAVLRRTLP